MTTVPARLDMRIGCPSLTRLTIWPMRICRFTPGSSPNAAHIAMSRCTYPWWSAPSMMMQRLKPAFALVEVVGQVAGDVGGVAVGLDDDAVLVVAEVGRAQPRGPVRLEDVAELAQTRHRPLHGSRIVQVVLVEVHVEVDAELVQRLLDLGEHEVHAELTERLLLGRRVEGIDVAVVGQGDAPAMSAMYAPP